MTQNSNNNITAVILAGGKGRRMEGRDKGLVPVVGGPLIGKVIDRIKPQVTRILISANRNIAEYSRFGFPVVEDSLDSFAGPLSGILSAMDLTDGDKLVVIPCDMPLVPDDIVNRLESCLSESGADVCCVREHDRLQPLVCILRTTLRDRLYTFLSQEKHKVRDWLQSQKLATLDYPEGNGRFININTREELIDFENRIDCEQER